MGLYTEWWQYEWWRTRVHATCCLVGFTRAWLSIGLHTFLSAVQAAAVHPNAPHPLLLWNCLPRAGASQFHGHMQVALSQARHTL